MQFVSSEIVLGEYETPELREEVRRQEVVQALVLMSPNANAHAPTRLSNAYPLCYITADLTHRTEQTICFGSLSWTFMFPRLEMQQNTLAHDAHVDWTTAVGPRDAVHVYVQ